MDKFEAQAERDMERIERRDAVIEAAREVVKEVRATSGGDGGSNWFESLASLLKAVEALDGKPEE